MKYLVVFEKGDKGQWGAYVPDLPGCTAVGTSKAEVRKLIAESIRLWIETAKRQGWFIPPPSSTATQLNVGA